MDKKEIEVTKFALTNNVDNEKTLELSLKINKTAYDLLKDIAMTKPQFVPETVQPCCTEIRNLCDTCQKKFICPLPHINLREKCELYEKLPNPLDEYIAETRSLNPIKEENKMEARKERLKEEYSQLKERYEKITKYKNIQEVELNLADKTQTTIEHYRYRLLDQQMRAMGEYLHILELRAVLESIDLN